jgi:enterobacterial common antigen flippase
LRTGLTLARKVAGRLLRPRGGIFAMMHGMATQIVGLALNMGTGIISARLLGPAGRGELAAIILWLQLPSLLAIAGIQNAIVYHTGRQPEQAASISVAGFLLSTALFIPMALICFWWLPSPMHAYGPSIVTVARIVLIISVLSAWAIVVRQSLLAVRNFYGYNAGGYGTSLAYFLILLALVGLHNTSAQALAWAQVVALVGVLAILTIVLTFNWEWRSLRPFACIRDVAAYAWKAAPIDFVTILIGNIDRLILVGLLSPAMFGIYAVASSFARILLILQALSAVVLVELIELTQAQVELFIHRLFRLLLWTLAILAGTFFLFDEWLLGLVYGSDFIEAAPIFRILLIEAATVCIGHMLMQAFLAGGAPAIPSVVQVITIGTTVAGMFLLVPQYGAIGAAVALAAASCLRLGLLLWLLRRIGVGLPNPLPRWSDLEPILNRIHRLRRERSSARNGST